MSNGPGPTAGDRLPIELYLLTVAHAVAIRSTCRRKVGCVLADRAGRILATGYNGSPRGVPNCADRGCTAHQCEGPHGCSKCPVPGSCDTVHAEANALLQCREPNEVHYAVINRAPCLPCLRQLMNSGVKVILYAESSSHTEAEAYWRAHRKQTYHRWEQLQAKIDIKINVGL